MIPNNPAPLADDVAYSYLLGARPCDPSSSEPRETVFVMRDGRRVTIPGHHIARSL
jgi:hypothetical protein